MTYDLVIRNGSVVDGSGSPRFQADVGIRGDRIAAVGRLDEPGIEEIDAEGHIVCPGFIDGHTHMDAQVFWDPLGSSSCWHGVTSVVMGNCGFTLAPCRAGEHALVVNNLERAEDIPGPAMAAGIGWTWDSFPGYLAAVEAAPKAINYAAQVGHCALRTHAMGERAYSESATEEDLAAMALTLEEALRAGAVGFTTTAGENHFTSDGRPVASRLASKEELSRLVGVLGDLGVGVFQTTPARDPQGTGDPEAMKGEWQFLRDLAVRTRVPVTYGLSPRFLPYQLENLEETATAGGQLVGLSRSVSQSLILSFRSDMPFDRLPVWEEFRARPLDAQLAGLRDPAIRASLVEAVNAAYSGGAVVSVSNQRPAPLPAFEVLEVMLAGRSNPSVATMAAERGVSPIELILDLAVESELGQVFGRFTGWGAEDLLTAMRHPRTLMTFSDSGAHVGHHSGAELQTIMLAEWVRERQAFTLEEAVRMMTSAPAAFWRLTERGLLREGMVADIVVFDPARVDLTPPAIATDLPAGARRVVQGATGYLATMVAGRPTFRSGEHTGSLPGRVLRAALADGGSRRDRPGAEGT